MSIFFFFFLSKTTAVYVYRSSLDVFIRFTLGLGGGGGGGGEGCQGEEQAVKNKENIPTERRPITGTKQQLKHYDVYKSKRRSKRSPALKSSSRPSS